MRSASSFEPLLFFHKRLEHALHLVIDRLLAPRAGVLFEIAYLYIFAGIYPAQGRLKLAGDELEEGRFARCVRADEAYLIALSRLQSSRPKTACARRTPYQDSVRLKLPFVISDPCFKDLCFSVYFVVTAVCGNENAAAL